MTKPWIFPLLALIASIGLSPNAQAGGAIGAGNGGYGLLLEGKAYVLDLVEAGVEREPFYRSEVAISPEIHERVRALLPLLPEVHEKLSHKLSEVHRISPAMAWAIVESFRLFDVRIVREALVDIHDLDDSVVHYDPASLIPLAIRREHAIFLNGQWWPSLELDQKVALLIHEAIYAFQHMQTVRYLVGRDPRGLPIFEEGPGQRSAPARLITGYLFTTRFAEQGIEGLKRIMHRQNRLERLLLLDEQALKRETHFWGLSFEMSPGFIQRTDGAMLTITSKTRLKDLARSCHWAQSKGLNFGFYNSASVFLPQNPKVSGIEIALRGKHSSGYVSCFKLLTEYRSSLPESTLD